MAGHGWKTTTLGSLSEVEDMLLNLHAKQWYHRGQSRYDSLIPKIDRIASGGLSRIKKLVLERSSIDLFRSTVRVLGPGEEGAFADDVIALMVMRHYGVHTRLLDWSANPYVAAYFACQEGDDNNDGEIWTFSADNYRAKGDEQWTKWPQATKGSSGRGDDFDAKLTMFEPTNPPPWLICSFYPRGFPRQQAQSGFFTLTADFNRDHAEAIKSLLNDLNAHHLYIIDKKCKGEARNYLRHNHGVWRGTLFPDAAGAADTAASVFPK